MDLFLAKKLRSLPNAFHQQASLDFLETFSPMINQLLSELFLP